MHNKYYHVLEVFLSQFQKMQILETDLIRKLVPNVLMYFVTVFVN